MTFKRVSPNTKRKPLPELKDSAMKRLAEELWYWCNANGYQQRSADELLPIAKSQIDKLYLHSFIERWNLADKG